MALQRQITKIVAQYSPRVRKAFLAAIKDTQDNIDWDNLLRAIEDRDVEAVIKAMHISEASYQEYEDLLIDIFSDSGKDVIRSIEGIDKLGVRWNIKNPVAEAWVEANVANKVVGITREQIELVREIVEAGIAEGKHPFQIAISIAGRATGKRRERIGGIVGLDGPRARRYNNVVSNLTTSEGIRSLVVEHPDGSVSLRYKVNKSTENRILRAYRANRGLSGNEAAISEVQYKNALLKHRADTIAQTETANAVMGGRETEWKILVQEEGISPEHITKRWEHRRGASKYHRPDHLAMSGVTVQGLNTPFLFPDGEQLRWAHDINGSAAHVINCGCDTTFIYKPREEEDEF